MKIVWNWLADWVELQGSVEQVTETLIQAGVEIAGTRTLGVNSPDLVVAQVQSSEPHPDADRLSVCQVDDGSGQPRQIVCGAKNYKVGDKVPLALPGAVLPGNFKIKVGKLRGVRSEGMMCSAKELQLADDADGLLILPQEAEAGQPVGDLFPPETVIEIEVTPNRPDQLSHRGIARLLNAYLGWPLLEGPIPELIPDDAIARVPVEVTAKDACPVYIARRLTGVTVGPSPDWMARRLELAGLRPINNIVDITNYILLDIGHPLHAFDATKMAEERIVVRMAQPNEIFQALDGSELKLQPSQPVIADVHQAQALAGVMGGEKSGVEAGAVDLILESAWFDPPTIRQSARLAGISSDSSYRFERGADPAVCQEASIRAAALIIELAGGRAGAMTEVVDGSIQQPRTVSLRPEKAAALIGAELDPHTIDQYLLRIGCQKSGADWQVPTGRLDLQREIDLIEEIAHLHGLDQVPVRMAGPFAAENGTDRAHDRRLALLHQAAALGFHEARNLTLLPAEPPYPTLEWHPDRTPKAVRNPLTVDHVTLRTSLVPGLLTNLVHNLHAGIHGLQLCEAGQIYWDGGQEWHLALLVTGPVQPASWWNQSGAVRGFHHLKGVLELLTGDELQFTPVDRPGYIPAYEMRCGEQQVGMTAQVAPSVQRQLDAQHPIWVAELTLAALSEKRERRPTFAEFARLPAISRDIAFLAPVHLQHAAVLKTVRSVQDPLIEEVALFDIFEDPTGEKLPPDKKSMAYSIRYRAPDRTLTTEEANKTHDKVRAALTQQLAVELRE